ncbi:MAG: hypothetical protein JWR20_72 [Marmoricola sp.]|nr:hypothetical protein [Marmoricola sp.]
MTRTIEADYLVVGAGAMGMGFVDALLDDSDAHVVMVDRRDGVGGHWRAAYPFVRLHQSSTFYGVASTVLGGHVQTEGPEAGLHERADKQTVLDYYDEVLERRMLRPGRVELFTGCEWDGGRGFTDLVSGERHEVPAHCRLVDARYLAPEVPSETPSRFAVEDGVRVVPVNALAGLQDRPSRYVVVGSGKTATDAVVRLLGEGVDPDAICWVRPREPWMLDRAVVQPDPAVYLAMVAGMMREASSATSLDELFLRLEDAGTMLRLDPAVTPSMAKAPTLGRWELDLLRTVTDVVRRGRVRSVRPGRMELDHGSVDLARDTLVVDCAADGLKNPPRVPVWTPEVITLQPVRAGFPCFGAAMVGHVEATRTAGRPGDAAEDAEKNRLCRPSSLGNSLVQWAQMNVLGIRNSAAFTSAPDLRAWADRVALNPARVPPEHPGSPALDTAREELARWSGPGVARLAELSGMTEPAGASTT